MKDAIDKIAEGIQMFFFELGKALAETMNYLSFEFKKMSNHKNNNACICMLDMLEEYNESDKESSVLIQLHYALKYIDYILEKKE